MCRKGEKGPRIDASPTAMAELVYVVYVVYVG